MKVNRNIKGIIFSAVFLYVAIAGCVGWVGYEVKQVFMPNTHKTQIQATDTQAQKLAQDANDNVIKLNVALKTDEKALDDLKTAFTNKQKQVTDAAGYAQGTATALEGGDVQIAQVFNNDTIATLDAPSQTQVDTFKKAYLAMKADRDNIKSINDKLTAQSAQDRQTAQDSLTKAQVSEQAKKVAEDNAKLSAANLAKESLTHQAAEDKLNGQVSDNETIMQRLKAFGIGGSVFLFILIPLIGLAFPATLPFIKFITSPFLKLWHMIADKVEAELKTVQTKLVSEQAAHAQTHATLIQVALTPDLPAGTQLPVIAPKT